MPPLKSVYILCMGWDYLVTGVWEILDIFGIWQSNWVIHLKQPGPDSFSLIGVTWELFC